MGDKIQSPFIQPSSTPPHHPHTSKSNLSTLYYGIVVIGTTTIVFAIYYIIVLKWCFISRTSQSDEESTPNSSLHEVSTTSTTTRNFASKDFLCSFKFNKEEKERSQDGSSNDIYECAVCLSAFEDGEQVRTLPKCKHSFHAPCIDMWLYSHSDCPLCRTPVPVSTPCCGYHRRVINALEVEENARDVLVDSDSVVSV